MTVYAYVGRRVTSKGTLGHFFEDAEGGHIGFAKRPRLAIGVPIGTMFEVSDEGQGKYSFEKELGMAAPAKVKDWVMTDREQETQHREQLLKQRMVKGEIQLIDNMTIAEVRAMAVLALPAQRRAIIAVVLQRMGIF